MRASPKGMSAPESYKKLPFLTTRSNWLSRFLSDRLLKCPERSWWAFL